MWSLIKRAVHFVYDEELLPIRRENTANYITLIGAWLSRIGLMVLFVYFGLFAVIGHLTTGILIVRWVGIGLFILAALCDWADGFVARKLKIVSPFGELYDPHLDKVQYLTKLNGLFIDTAVMVLAGQSIMFIPQVVLIAWASFERDATSMFHRAWAMREAPGVKVSARNSGKWRTRICFPGILCFHLILHPISSPILGWINTILILVATGFSTYDYVRSYREAIKKARQS